MKDEKLYSAMQNKIKNTLATFWPFLFILGIWFIFGSPYFLNNKVPFPSTYQVNNFAPWNVEEKFWGPVRNGAMPDIITQIYPWRHLAIEIWKSGQIPLWNPYSFSGTPLLANYQSGVLSPLNILFFIFPFIDAWSILVLLQPLLAGLFMYLFVRSLRISKTGSLISSVSFMFSGFITSWMGYATLGYAILFLPLSLFCVERYYKTKNFIFLLFLTLTIPLSFFSGHFQISLYFLLTIIVYTVYKFFTTNNILSTLYLIIHVFFGLFISLPQVLPSIELYLESFRSSFLQKGGIPIEYIPTFVAPDFFGNPVTRNNWFGYYAEWNSYIGIFPLMLASYSILGKKKSQTFFLFIFSIIILTLAFMTPVQELFVNLHIPVIASSPTGRIIALYCFLVSTLSAFGLDKLILDIKDKRIYRLIIWLGSFCIIFLVLWIVVYLKLFIPQMWLPVVRSNLILPTAIFAFSAIIVLFTIFNKKILPISVCLLFFIVSFDMLRFAIKWMPFDPKNLVFPKTTTTASFAKISGFRRVLGNFGGEASIYYKLPSVEGYDALYIKRYGELIGFINSREILKSAWSVVNLQRSSEYTRKVINLLDIKYIAHKLKDNRKVWTFPFWIYPKDQFKLIYKDSKYEFYENAKALPHAFLVGQYKVISDPEQILSNIFSKDFDLRNEVILEEDPGVKKTKEYMGTVYIDAYSTNKVSMTVEANHQGLLFLTDNYYNGWKAKVDGINVPIYRTDYAFRSIPVKAGKYNVEFAYEPLSFRLGIYMALSGIMGVFIVFLISKYTNPVS